MTNAQSRFAFIGSGPTTIAMVHALMARGVDRRDIIVVDREPPMGFLGRCVRSIGMDRMRSGWEVSVTGDPGALKAFAAALGLDTGTRTPPWGLFDKHARAVWHHLDPVRVPARVRSIGRHAGIWNLGVGPDRTLTTERLVVATGLGPHRLPVLRNAVGLPDTGEVLAPTAERIAIIGGGISAAHVAANYLAAGATVTMFVPRGLRVADRDATDEWFSGTPAHGCASGMDVEAMRRDLRARSPRERIEIIHRDGQPGTVNEELARALSRAMRDGTLTIVTRRVRSVSVLGTVHRDRVVHDEHGGQYGPFDQVFDARGYRVSVENLGGIRGLQDAIGTRHVQGLPLLDEQTCEVAPGLILAGALAPMNYGPVAHTVAGAVAQGREIARIFC